jgi:hypothetical protein
VNGARCVDVMGAVVTARGERVADAPTIVAGMDAGVLGGVRCRTFDDIELEVDVEASGTGGTSTTSSTAIGDDVDVMVRMM